LRYAHEIVRSLTEHVILEGGGLVVTLGGEPKLESTDQGKIFDWTVLDSFSQAADMGDAWPFDPGSQLVAVGFYDWKGRIPSERKSDLRRIARTKKMELVPLKSGLNIGGLMRQVQASYGDVLVTLGGGPGTEHLGSLYNNAHKPVIPLDLDIGSGSAGRRASQRMADEAIRTPHRFFGSSGRGLSGIYSTLSFDSGNIPPVEFSDRFFEFFRELPPPGAFFVRLQKTDHPDFGDVEWFFRNVVDKAVSELDFRKFETGVDTSSEPFLNVEIFHEIARSALVIADVTGLRPNCFMEMGYALGEQKRVIITARERTELPFDVASFPCFFWPVNGEVKNLSSSFIEFVRRNIGRAPLIGIDDLMDNRSYSKTRG
jgi:hypothetical protein